MKEIVGTREQFSEGRLQIKLLILLISYSFCCRKESLSLWLYLWVVCNPLNIYCTLIIRKSSVAPDEVSINFQIWIYFKTDVNDLNVNNIEKLQWKDSKFVIDYARNGFQFLKTVFAKTQYNQRQKIFIDLPVQIDLNMT